MKPSIVDKTMKSLRRIGNFQLSILQFSNNFQKFEFSKYYDVSALFDNLIIDNLLKIGNWKLNIWGLVKENNRLNEDGCKLLNFSLKVS
ncbi:MAG: hypothetical protein Q7S57_01510 [bacterium]|nr:hypothetical protein [bacterium]